MSEHIVDLAWKNTAENFTYKVYSRDYEWSFDNGQHILGSAATAYFGNPQLLDPEEVFVASISACHMLTFLAVCSMQKIEVLSYSDHAIGYLARDENKVTLVQKVALNPKIVFAEGQTPDQETLSQLHDKAHHQCFIANSVKSEIVINI